MELQVDTVRASVTVRSGVRTVRHERPARRSVAARLMERRRQGRPFGTHSPCGGRRANPGPPPVMALPGGVIWRGESAGRR